MQGIRERQRFMWINIDDAFFSIVAHHDQADCLLIRAQREGDIERYWPAAETRQDEGIDYNFRAVIPRYIVAGVISEHLIKQLQYDNHKNSSQDNFLQQIASHP